MGMPEHSPIWSGRPIKRLASAATHKTGTMHTAGKSYLLPILRVRLWLHPRKWGGKAVWPQWLDITAGLGKRTLSLALGTHYSESSHGMIRTSNQADSSGWPGLGIASDPVLTRDMHVVAFGKPLWLGMCLARTILSFRPTPLDLIPYFGLTHEPDRFLETGVTTGCVNLRISFICFQFNLSAQATYLTREQQRQERILGLTLPRLSPRRLIRRV